MKAIGLKVLGVVLAVGSFLSMAYGYSDGDGSAGNPYQIANVADWQQLMNTSSHWNKCFILTADINLAGITVTPVGNNSTKFTGQINGSGNVIRNAVINQPGSDYVGLFGRVNTGGQISNLGVVDAQITGRSRVGGLVGDNFGGTITSCYATGEVSGSGNKVGGLVGCNLGGTFTSCHATGTVSGNSEVGGLVGYNGGTLTSCYATGAVSGYSKVGGLVGRGFDVTITSCYATGAVSGTDYYVGGLVGENMYGTITSCYAIGTVSGNSEVGGLVGYNGGTLTSCYAIGAVSGSEDVGGLVGRNYYGSFTTSFWDIQASGQTDSSGGKGLTTVQMKTLSLFQNVGWGDYGWVMVDGAYPRLAWEGTGYAPIPLAGPVPLAGSGTEAEPYQITTAADFALLSWYVSVLDKHLLLAADIDLSGVLIYPIGDLGPFVGTFDGGGHAIHHAVINQPSNYYVGLFGYVGTGGQIRNLGVVDAQITGDDYVGGLVGENRWGTITSCYATGAVSGHSSVGGLVGENLWGTITSCYTTGAVSGSEDVGGLVGRNDGTLTSCYANSQVTGGDGACVMGGLCGLNTSSCTIINCYATGAVRGGNSSYDLGGLCGSNFYGVIVNCYSAGTVTGGTSSYHLGGFCGYQSSSYSEMANSFWDTDTSGMMVGYNLDPSSPGTVTNVLGKTTTEMKTMSTFATAGWDFVNTWRMCGDGVDYPRFLWDYQRRGDFDCPNGTAGEDLAYFSGRWLMTGWCQMADRNKDSQVNLLDFASLTPEGLSGFVGSWLEEGCGDLTRDDGDINGDNRVNLADFCILAANWLEGV